MTRFEAPGSGPHEKAPDRHYPVRCDMDMQTPSLAPHVVKADKGVVIGASRFQS
jgi:hypothetical protein